MSESQSMNALIILILVQVLFSVSNVLARLMMRGHIWNWGLLSQPWLYAYLFMQVLGISLQLYVFTTFELGKTITLLSVTAIVTSVGLGWLVLGEKLSPLIYVSIALAITAFLLLAYARSS
jgi:drug/metabolite transporter (DMT)-like permease